MCGERILALQSYFLFLAINALPPYDYQDGGCLHVGCQDPTASNYDPSALLPGRIVVFNTACPCVYAYSHVPVGVCVYPSQMISHDLSQVFATRPRWAAPTFWPVITIPARTMTMAVACTSAAPIARRQTTTRAQMRKTSLASNLCQGAQTRQRSTITWSIPSTTEAASSLAA